LTNGIALHQNSPEKHRKQFPECGNSMLNGGNLCQLLFSQEINIQSIKELKKQDIKEHLIQLISVNELSI
jgi:hypothetical protein